MTRLLPCARKSTLGLVRLAVFTLIVTLTQPLPAMTGNDAPSGNEHVLRRLNGPERAAAIEEARRMDAAAREAFTDSASGAPSVSTAAARPEPKTMPDEVSRRTERPKTVTEVLFNGITGFMGMPGLQGNEYDPYNPNADQGLGFHQDGTARRADGTTGNSAAGANFDGRRAASSMAHGLGYGPGSHGGHGMSDMNGWYGAGYDPVMGYNQRLGDPAMGARGAGGGMGSGGGMFDMTGMDPQRYFMQRGLNYGVGRLNSLGEAAFTGLFDKGRARLNFMADLDGRVNGEGDVLYPFYDGRYTTVFTQVGARTMAGMSGGDDEHGRGADRWIGNFGLGQRWYPAANISEDGKTVDSGNWMFGYNVFFDNDFTRSHQRGGVGLEAQWDWLKLAYNHYLPLSGWKGSYDFDSRFVEERPAQGWDVRVKGYLPFYRNVAVTGAYTQWYGEKVAMFSTGTLEKDPKVWSYGLEYTPVPMLSAFWNQRSTERGRNDTEFGLRFTWHFGMSWDDQTSHAKVADLRTVSASRHEFVDRENRIILEYRAKNAYRIEYLGPDGANGHLFRLQDGFGAYKAGQSVRVIAGGAWLAGALSAAGYMSDGQGRFWIQLDAAAPDPATVTVTAGDNSQSFSLAGGSGAAGRYISIESFADGGAFASGSSTASVTVRVKNADGTDVADNTQVIWTVTRAQNNSPAMYQGWGARRTGLNWGNSPRMVLHDDNSDLTVSVTSATASGLATIQLTDIVGERVITIEARVHLDNADHTVNQAVRFGDGPLVKFTAPPDATGRTWAEAYELCNGRAPSGEDDPSTWTVQDDQNQYRGGGKLPDIGELQAVSAVDTRYGANPDASARGAALAAGWPDLGYWTGVAYGTDYARGVGVVDGNDLWGRVGSGGHTVCRR